MQIIVYNINSFIVALDCLTLISYRAVEHEVVELRTALRKRVPHYDDDVHFKVNHLKNKTNTLSI